MMSGGHVIRPWAGISGWGAFAMTVPVDKSASYLGLPAAAPPSAEDSALAVLRRSSVLAALSTLSFRQREVIVLRYYADLSEPQIAAALGISRGAVKSHVARAKDSLREMLV